MNEKTDQLFAKPQAVKPFSFDQSVAEVFSDMINRSVPGYSQIIATIGSLASRFVRDNSNVYDLGCSLGAAILSVAHHIEDRKGVTLIGVDNSAAMIARARAKLGGYRHSQNVLLLNDDIDNVKFENASFVVLNFTLQFIKPEKRQPLLARICEAMQPGDALVFSEKIVSPDERCNELLVSLHHEFKKNNGYSELEISQKRNALENVLIPETIATHRERTLAAGFSHFECWFKNFNFASFIAIK